MNSSRFITAILAVVALVFAFTGSPAWAEDSPSAIPAVVSNAAQPYLEKARATIAAQSGPIQQATASAIKDAGHGAALAGTGIADGARTAGTAVANTVQAVTPTLTEALKDMVQGIHDGAMWTLQQIPDVIRELLVWTIVKDSVAVLLLLGVVIGCAITLWKAGKYSFAKAEKTDGLSIVLFLFGGAGVAVAGGFAAVSMATFGNDLLMVTLAPKVWLLQYAAHLFQ